MKCTKSIRPEGIFVDKKNDAIVVQYIEEIFDGSSKKSLSVVTKQVKIFPNNKAIDDDVNISKLARKIIKKCKHIPQAWLSRVEDVLFEIQQRQKCGNDQEVIVEMNVIDKHIDGALERALEFLYGDEDDKFKGSVQVLSLCENVDNLETIGEHHQMISALARVMSEKTSLSTDTAFNIGKIFLSMAAFEDFHPILAKYKIGSVTMEVINQAISNLNDSSLDSRKKAFSNDECRGAMLFVCFSILNRLADDPDVLKKMLKKGIVDIVADCVSLNLPECTSESTLFKLHRISVYGEIAAFCSQDQCLIIEFLVSKLHLDIKNITQRAFSVLYNLSFNKGCCGKMVSTGLTKILSRFIHSTIEGGMALKVLYQLSTDRHQRKKLLIPSLEISIIKACKRTFKNRETNDIVYAILINVSLEKCSFVARFCSINIWLSHQYNIFLLADRTVDL